MKKRLLFLLLPLACAQAASPWSVFQDPALEGLIRQALAANQDLRQAVARVSEARAESQVAASALYPHLDAPLRAGRQRTTDTGPIVRSRIVGGFPIALPATAGGSAAPGSFAGQQATTTFNDFQAPLSLSWEVDLFGRLRHAYAQARDVAAASAADREAVELSLSAQVASGYFALRALDAEGAVLRRTFQLRTESVQIQHERVKGGAASELDLSRAALEQANTEADLTEVWRQRGELQNNLAVLCGQRAGEFRVAARPLGETPPPPLPAGISSSRLTRRPDLQEADRRLAAAGEGIRTARAELFPVVSLRGDYGYESAEFGRLFEDRSRAWAIGGAVQIPIFEGGRNAANLRAAKARREEALAGYEQTALNAFREVENALLALRSRATQSEARARAAEQAQRVVDSSQKRYTEGAVNYFEVIDAQRLLLSAELLRLQTLQARYLATVDLIRATGGGFEESGVRTERR